jgi:hypothetical protein
MKSHLSHYIAGAALFAALPLNAQLPPTLDPSQVVSGRTTAGHYDYKTTDGKEHEGSIINNVDPSTGSGVIITIPDHGPTTTTLVSPGLSVTY